MILAATGHRPNKLGGYDADTRDRLRYFAEGLLREYEPELVLVRMAQGWDQAVASASMLLRVPFDAYVPCDGQELLWPEDAQQRYRAILKRAREINVVSPGPYEPWKMQRGNVAMVDALKSPDDRLLALFDGTKGGTANCVRYARSIGVKVDNVWRAWWEYKRGEAPIAR